MTTDDADLVKAREIVNAWTYVDNCGNEDCSVNFRTFDRDEFQNAIAAALKEARAVKPGCVRTDDGVERKVENKREFDSGRVDYILVRTKERPICQSCGAPDACDKESGQGIMCGISACRECFIEWYDGDRPSSSNRDSWEDVGNWVKSKREAAQSAKESSDED